MDLTSKEAIDFGKKMNVDMGLMEELFITPFDRLISVEELVKYIGLSQTTIYRMIKAGKLSHYRLPATGEGKTKILFDLRELLCQWKVRNSGITNKS